jgi:hypothetical protein
MRSGLDAVILMIARVAPSAPVSRQGAQRPRGLRRRQVDRTGANRYPYPG